MAAKFLIKISFVVVLAALSGMAFQQSLAGNGYYPNSLIVRYKQTPASSSLSALSQMSGVSKVVPVISFAKGNGKKSNFESSVFKIVFDDTSKFESVRSLLNSDPSVKYAEPDYKFELFSDALSTNQWSLHNTGQQYLGVDRIPGDNNDRLVLKTGTSGADIKWGSVQNAHTERHRTKVAIIDTGVDYLHPDLSGNVWHNPGEIPGNGRDDDLNGLIDDYYGYDFSGDASGLVAIPDSDPMDYIGHGTHVSGIIGAVGGNGIGVEGIARNVSLMCIKIFPNATASTIAEGIAYAVDNGAEVINASWGSPYYSSIVFDAVNYAVDNGVLFVVASGNSGDGTPFFPANFDNVITVGATDSGDRVTTFSTFGSWLDIAAPGLDILSLRANTTDLYAEGGEPRVRIVDSLYYLADGTSMACPHVVGAAAFLLSISPGLSSDSLRNLLLSTADKISDPSGTFRPNFNVYSGNGRVNLARAVAFLSDEFAELENPSDNALVSDTVRFVGSAFSAKGDQYLLEALPKSTGVWTLISSGSADVIRDTLGVWNSSGMDGRTAVRLSVGDKVVYSTNLRLVNTKQIEILSPKDGDSVSSFEEIVGSASAPGFVSYQLDFVPDNAPKSPVPIKYSHEILYREDLADWTVSSIKPGPGRVRLRLITETDSSETSVHVTISSLLTAGYPMGGEVRPHFTTAIGNLDDIPGLEMVSGGASRIMIDHIGRNTVEYVDPHFGTSYRSALALYDFDHAGKDEIVLTSDSGVAIINGKGEMMPGWPKRITTGSEYDAYPTPLIADIDGDGTMEILIVNYPGIIYCWHANGFPYFSSRGGIFATIDTTGSQQVFGGPIVPFLFAYDFNGDGYLDVGTLFTSVGAEGGLYMYSGKNGQPLYPGIGARTLATQQLFGGVLADFDHDGEPDIAFASWIGGNTLQMRVNVVHPDGRYLPGWPKNFYNKIQWLSPYPAAADLDGDSIPELIMTFSALDGGEVYVWHGDGTPYSQDLLGPSGIIAVTDNSLGNPMIADVDNDGEYEIVVRGGALLFGKSEKVFAWKLDGTLAKGWPIYTYAVPSSVTYALYTPNIGDFNEDGKLEIYMPSSDQRLYSWNLPTIATPKSVLWGNFLYDSQHTGMLPLVFKRNSTPPPPPLPNSFAVAQNYPNPFNSSTVIETEVPSAGPMTLEIINILGQRVKTLYNGQIKAGYHRFSWDGSDQRGNAVASGVYLYRTKLGSRVETKKMVLLK